MTVKDIKIILLQRDLTISGLAEEFGCRFEELSMCIHRVRPYPRLRVRLARRLKIKVSELFAKTKEATPNA